MKKLIILSAFLTFNAFSSECTVAKNTKIRMMNELIKKGDIAVLRTGENVGVKEILADKMIFFKSASGEVSESYQWMYNRINNVNNRDNKFLSSSFGEDVVITIGDRDDRAGQTTINYNGTNSGNYLTLVCE